MNFKATAKTNFESIVPFANSPPHSILIEYVYLVWTLVDNDQEICCHSAKQLENKRIFD